MAEEASAGPNGHSSDSSTIPKSNKNPEIDQPTQINMGEKEENPIEYTHGVRFGFISAA